MNSEHDGDSSNPQWFAVRVQSRQEKVASRMLGMLGVTHFLPLKSEERQWSDRKQTVAVPLFSGYLFVHVDLSRNTTLQILRCPGVVSFVGNLGGPLSIPEQQIVDVRAVLAAEVVLSVQSSFKEGDRVRVVRGPLTGIAGILVQTNSGSRLLISIEMICQSVAVSVAPEDVELVETLSINTICTDDRATSNSIRVIPCSSTRTRSITVPDS